MHHLWSPWRARYLQEYPELRKKGTDRSLFRRIWEEDRDRENLVLWRGEEVFVVMNRYPYNPGHLLVLPNREVAAWGELTAAERNGMMRTIGRAIGWIEEALDPDEVQVGMNLGRTAGAGVPEHLHVHLVPRWGGEEGRPVEAVSPDELSSALEALYTRLCAVVAQ